MSVAVSVRSPAVLSVALKVWTPCSRVASAGKAVLPSLLVMWTVPK